MNRLVGFMEHSRDQKPFSISLVSVRWGGEVVRCEEIFIFWQQAAPVDSARARIPPDRDWKQCWCPSRQSLSAPRTARTSRAQLLHKETDQVRYRSLLLNPQFVIHYQSIVSWPHQLSLRVIGTERSHTRSWWGHYFILLLQNQTVRISIWLTCRKD